MSEDKENDYLRKYYDKQWGSLPAEPEGPEDDPRPLRKTQLEEKDAEIGRLKKLVTKLADVLEAYVLHSEAFAECEEDRELLKQAREATKDENSLL